MYKLSYVKENVARSEEVLDKATGLAGNDCCRRGPVFDMVDVENSSLNCIQEMQLIKRLRWRAVWLVSKVHKLEFVSKRGMFFD